MHFPTTAGRVRSPYRLIQVHFYVLLLYCLQNLLHLFSCYFSLRVAFILKITNLGLAKFLSKEIWSSHFVVYKMKVMFCLWEKEEICRDGSRTFHKPYQCIYVGMSEGISHCEYVNKRHVSKPLKRVYSTYILVIIWWCPYRLEAQELSPVRLRLTFYFLSGLD